MILRIPRRRVAGCGSDGSAEVNTRRRERGSAGFVWRYFGIGKGPRADAWVVGGRSRWRGGRRADAWVVRGHSGFLQFAESRVGFVMDSLETGFVTGHQREAARLVGQR